MLPAKLNSSFWTLSPTNLPTALNRMIIPSTLATFSVRCKTCQVIGRRNMSVNGSTTADCIRHPLGTPRFSVCARRRLHVSLALTISDRTVDRDHSMMKETEQLRIRDSSSFIHEQIEETDRCRAAEKNTRCVIGIVCGTSSSWALYLRTSRRSGRCVMHMHCSSFL
jgi:hypothetical protein